MILLSSATTAERKRQLQKLPFFNSSVAI